jgi:hypothetical protein
MVEPGDAFARSSKLDELVVENELDEFFEGLLQYCQEFGRELRKSKLGIESVMLCRSYRTAKDKHRQRRMTAEEFEVSENDCIWRAMELKEEVLTQFGRKAA